MISSWIRFFADMIQRIQSIYLLLAFVCLLLMNFWPIASFGPAIVNLQGVVSQSDIALEPILDLQYSYLQLPLMLLTLITIFLFKDRKKQMLLARLDYLLVLAFIVWMQIDLERFSEQSGQGIQVSYDISTFLPVIALAFLLLAHRAIKKDEELVRSLDRLR